MDDQELGSTLGRIEQKQDDTRGDIKELKDDVKDGFKLVNGRVRKLEAWRNWVMGGLGLGGFIIFILVKAGVFL